MSDLLVGSLMTKIKQAIIQNGGFRNYRDLILLENTKGDKRAIKNRIYKRKSKIN